MAHVPHKLSNAFPGSLAVLLTSGATVPYDMDAFKYLHKFVNLRILRKIETSEMTRKMLAEYRLAMERLVFIKDIAFVHRAEIPLGNILDDPEDLSGLALLVKKTLKGMK